MYRCMYWGSVDTSPNDHVTWTLRNQVPYQTIKSKVCDVI